MRTETLNQLNTDSSLFLLIDLTQCRRDRISFFTLFTKRLNLCYVNNQVSKMGVTSILVGNGVTLGAFRQGLTEFTQNHNSIEKNKQVWRDKYAAKPASSETEKD